MHDYMYAYKYNNQKFHVDKHLIQIGNSVATYKFLKVLYMLQLQTHDQANWHGNN